MTTTGKLVSTVRDWYRDNDASGVSPVVHYKALSNVAWLKSTAYAGDLKIYELVALCRAALQPRPETWRRFLKYLQELEESGAISSDEVAAVIASELTDRLLLEAEDDDEDVEAADLREVVERVKEAYRADAEDRIRKIEMKTAQTIERAEQSENEAQARAGVMEARLAEMELKLGSVADGIGKLTARLIVGVAGVALAIGAAFTLPGVIDKVPQDIRAVITYSMAVAFIAVSVLAILRGWSLRKPYNKIIENIRQWIVRHFFPDD